jgi:hypothetical protein
VAATYAGFLHLVTLWLPVNLAGLALMWKHSLSWRQLTSGRQSALSPHPTAGGGKLKADR